ncbi:MAG: stalk domain-containing protein [Bacillota bacterium]|nr:stalk domain-containing protein [Bacillota bacterium]
METKGKRIILMLLMIIMIVSSQYFNVFSETVPTDSYRFFADGIEYVPDSPIIKVDYELFVPLRLLEAVGITLSWDALSQEITYELAGNTLKMKLNSSEYTYNGSSGTTEQKPYLFNEKLYVPLKFIANKLRFTITIDETAKRIDSYTKPIKTPTYTLYLDGKIINTEAPVRKVNGEYWIGMVDIELINPCDTSLNGVTQTFSMTDSKNVFNSKFDTGEYSFNGLSGIMTSKPWVDYSTGMTVLYLPLRFMMSLYGISVTIDETSYTINILYPINVSRLDIYNTNFDIITNAQPKQITRGELCRFLVKSFGLNTTDQPTRIFPDVTPDNEYFREIYIVYRNNLMEGYEDRTFRPETGITKAEYAVILCKALGYKSTENNILIDDVHLGWYETYVKTIVDAGLMGLNENNCFEPNSFLSLDFSGQIMPIISPSTAVNKKVLWKSNNENIAVVDKTGHITGKSPGKAVITCTTEDGGFTKTCNVNVRSNGTIIYGYIKPDVNLSDTNIRAGFKVEIEGTSSYAYSDQDGYFYIECPGVDSEDILTLKISKAGYLARKLTFNYKEQLNTKETPLIIWPGDIDQNNYINLADIIEMAKSFNSLKGDAKYNSICDFDLNGAINMSDIICAVKWFNRESGNYQ